jgi:hypothetical protein
MSVTGTIGAIGAIGGGIASAVGSSAAAGAQADAANNAANLQRQNAVDALNFQKQVYGDQQKNIAPWLASGRGALSNLDFLMGIRPQTDAPPQGQIGQTGGGVPGSGTGNPFVPGVGPVPSRATGGPDVLPFQADGNTPSSPNINSLRALQGNSAMMQPITSGGTTGQAGAAGMLQLGPDGQPTGVTKDVNPVLNNGNPLPINPPQNGQPSQSPQNASTDGSIEQLLQAQGGGLNLGGNGTPLSVNPQSPQNASGSPGTVPRTDGGGDPNAAGVPGGAFGSLAQGFNEKFSAPTNVTEQNDPGYQFRLAQGDKAIQNSAAARGGLLSGGTAKSLSDYNQSSASGEYGNVYNRALTEYQQRYNIFNNNQSTLFNRLADLSGFGQTAAGQLNSAGTSAANNVSNTLLTSGGQVGQNINNAGAATGSGYVGVGNAVSGGLNNLASIYALLRSQGSSGASDPNAGMGVF